jgi:hypothetical protein
MEFIGFNEQTSILILVGLGFVFFLIVGFTFLKTRSSIPIRILLGLIRASMIVALIAFIIPVYIPQLVKGKYQTILMVDSSPFIQKKQIDSVFGLVKDTHSNLEVFTLSTSDWSSALDRLRKENQGKQIDEVFFLTDGNLSVLDSENDLGFPIHILPMGPLVPREEIGLFIPFSRMRTVIGENVQIPVDVWMKDQKKKQIINLQMREGKRLLFEKSISFDLVESYKHVELPLTGNKLGKFSLNFYVGSRNVKELKWEVIQEKAFVDVFAKAPHPNLGLIHKYAKEHYIKLNWHFSKQIKVDASMKKLIFYEVLPTDYTSLSNRSAWYLGMDLPKEYRLNAASLHIKDVRFWEAQMDEYRNNSSFFKIDSVFVRYFSFTFLRDLQGDTLSNRELIIPLVDKKAGRNEEVLNYLAGKEQVDFSMIKNKIGHKDEFKSLPLWKYSYFWAVLLVLILADWGIRKWYI